MLKRVRRVLSRVMNYMRRAKRLLILDPVYKCNVHLKLGCSHVDGMLCDFPGCSMRRQYDRTGSL